MKTSHALRKGGVGEDSFKYGPWPTLIHHISHGMHYMLWPCSSRHRGQTFDHSMDDDDDSLALLICQENEGGKA